MLKFKHCIFLITYSIIFLFFIINLPYIWSVIRRIVIILTPFIYGFIIAYIVNWPYEFFRKKIFFRKKSFNKISNKILLNKGSVLSISKKDKLLNLTSIVLSYSLLLGAFVFLIFAIVPQLFINLKQFADNFSRYSSSFLLWYRQFEKGLKLDLIPDDYIDQITKNSAVWLNKFIGRLFPSVFDFTKSFAISLYNWIIGIIISFYLIWNKEKLKNQLKMIATAYIPEKVTSSISRILFLTHDTFGKFLAGKIIDSFIVGILCFVGTSILRIPYTLLISTIITITNIIPFFGPFIGAIPCIIMLFIIDSTKALWFAIFILILQQVDGNIIGPKVLGNTVGISGMWIMFSVIIGGGIWGIPGMIVGVPIFAVIYTVISENIYNKNLENTMSLNNKK